LQNEINKTQNETIKNISTQSKSYEELRAEENLRLQKMNSLNAAYLQNENIIKSNEAIVTDIKGRLAELMGTYDNLSSSINTTNTATSNFNDTTKKATNELLDNWSKFLTDLQNKFTILKTENENRGKDELTLLVEERLKVKMN